MKTKIIKGYVFIYLPNHPNSKKGYYQAYKWEVEKLIGRFLKPEEVVHHIDSNRENNKIHNLMLFPNQKAHASFHLKVRQFNFTNPILNQLKNRWTGLITNENRKEINKLIEENERRIK